MSIRVLLVDDRPLVRQGLRALIEKEDDLGVVGEASLGQEAVRQAQGLEPQVILLNLHPAGPSGRELSLELAEKLPEARILILWAGATGRFVEQLGAAGAAGYLPYSASVDMLFEAVRSLAGGRTFPEPAVAGNPLPSTPSGRSLLTPREREVLGLLADGQSTKQIASSLDVSPKTVDAHRQRIMRKVGLHSVAELTKLAIREGLTSLEL